MTRLALVLAVAACERADRTSGTVTLDGHPAFLPTECHRGEKFGFHPEARVFGRDASSGSLTVSEPARSVVVFVAPSKPHDRKVEIVLERADCTTYEVTAERVRLDCSARRWAEGRLRADLVVGVCP